MAQRPGSADFLHYFCILALIALSAGFAFAGTAGTAVRTLPATYTPGSPINVSIDATPLAGTTVYGVDEFFPAGWVVNPSDVNCTVVSTGARCSQSEISVLTGDIQWGIMDGLERNLTYVITPPIGSSGTKTFSGTFEDYTSSTYNPYSITGNSAISQANQPPTVFISAPLNNAGFNAPASFDVNATAGDVDGLITNVKFYLDANATPFATDTDSPYSARVANLSASGRHTIRVVATDNNGGTGYADVNVLINAAPTVTLSTNGTSFTAPASIILTATATDSDGNITKVDFNNGTTLLNSDTASPYTYTWSPVATGTYNLTATATDNNGAKTVSNTVMVTVNPAPDTQAPTTPTGLSANAISPTQINLSWTASTDNTGVAGYTVYSCAGASCTPAFDANTTTVTFSDTGLTQNTQYTYAVAAYDSARNLSPKTSNVSATTPQIINGSCGATVNTCALGTLQDTTDSPTQYLWDCNANQWGTTAHCALNKPTFTLTVAKNGSGTGTIIGKVSGSTVINCGADCNETVVTGTVIDLNAAANAGSAMASWNGTCTGTGICSVTITANTTVTATFTDTTPPSITAVTAGGITQARATITWTTDKDSNSRAQYGLTTAYTNTATDTNMLKAHSLAISGLAAGTLYHYKVTSADASGNIGSSADYNFTTLSAYHAADTGRNGDINFSEYLYYANQWKLSMVTQIDYLNAANIWKMGPMAYHYVLGTECPPNTPSICWVPGS